MTRKCSINGCGKVHFGRGWCKAHYSRWRNHGDPLAGKAFEGAPLAFLLTAIKRETDDCIPWPFGAGDGYGVLQFDGRKQMATRVVLTLTEGPPPSGKHVAAHAPLICHNPSCINKRHLRWALPHENTADQLLDRTRTGKLTDADVRNIRSSRQTQRALAQRYGIDQALVSRIRNGLLWGHVA